MISGRISLNLNWNISSLSFRFFNKWDINLLISKSLIHLNKKHSLFHPEMDIVIAQWSGEVSRRWNFVVSTTKAADYSDQH